MLVLDRVLGRAYGTAVQIVASHGDIAAAETAALGANHAEVGELMARNGGCRRFWRCRLPAISAASRSPIPSLQKLTELVAIGRIVRGHFRRSPPAVAIAVVRAQCQSSVQDGRTSM